jgi:enoyl-CoA hydratase/carnithine racemase
MSNVRFQETLAEETVKMGQIKLTQSSPRYWRVTFDNPSLNLMGPEFVLEFREIVAALETDQELRVGSSTARSRGSF